MRLPTSTQSLRVLCLSDDARARSGPEFAHFGISHNTAAYTTSHCVTYSSPTPLCAYPDISNSPSRHPFRFIRTPHMVTRPPSAPSPRSSRAPHKSCTTTFGRVIPTHQTRTRLDQSRDLSTYSARDCELSCPLTELSDEFYLQFASVHLLLSLFHIFVSILPCVTAPWLDSPLTHQRKFHFLSSFPPLSSSFHLSYIGLPLFRSPRARTPRFCWFSTYK